MLCGSGEAVKLFEQNGHALRRCSTCSLHYVEPMPAQTVRMTELEAGHFGGGQSVLDASRQQLNEQRRAATHRQYIDMAKGQGVRRGTWLDIGCGAGGLLNVAAAAGFMPEGIELTADRRALATESTGFVIHGRPLEDLDFTSDSVDVVSMVNVFSHLTDPVETMKELRRVLRPGGVLLIVTGVVGDGARIEHSSSWSLGEHLFFLGEGTIERLADATGFNVVDRLSRSSVDTYITHERFSMRGSSWKRNLAKDVVRLTPGGITLARAMMRRRHRDNPVRPSVFALV